MALNYLGKKSAAFVVMLLLSFVGSSYGQIIYNSSTDRLSGTYVLASPSATGTWWIAVYLDGVILQYKTPTQFHYAYSTDKTFTVNVSTATWPTGVYKVVVERDDYGDGLPDYTYYFLEFEILVGPNPDPDPDPNNPDPNNPDPNNPDPNNPDPNNPDPNNPDPNNPDPNNPDPNNPDPNNPDPNNPNPGNNETVNMPEDLPGPDHMAPNPGPGGLEEFPEGTQPGTIDEGFLSKLQGVAGGIPGFGAVDQSDWVITLPWLNDETKTFVLPVFSNPNINFLRGMLRALLALAITAFFLWRIINDIKSY